MKLRLRILLPIMAVILLVGCRNQNTSHIVATTRPVYQFTSILCQGTDLKVGLLVTENVSCLHDYTMQVRQMKAIEKAELLIINGAGLEAFLHDIMPADTPIIDCSKGIPLICHGAADEEHTEHEHAHEADPHIWMDITNAKQMAQNICSGLIQTYPQYASVFQKNLDRLNGEFSAIMDLAKLELTEPSCKEMLTFHDGFSYLAQCFGLNILAAIEEESGSEASAAELIEMIQLVQDNGLPAIFVETNGSVSAASIIQSHTGVQIFTLDMCMSDRGYFDAMRHNIQVLKEALQ